MTRKIIATILAAALSITTINVSTVQAGDRDVARIIVGATALAIIGSALAAEQRNKRTETTTTRHQPTYRPYKGHPQRADHGWKKKKQHYGQGQRYRPALSRQCLLSVRGQQGWTQGYAVRCAQRSTRATLPSDCVRRNFAQGPRLFYAPNCLRRNGFDA